MPHPSLKRRVSPNAKKTSFMSSALLIKLIPYPLISNYLTTLDSAPSTHSINQTNSGLTLNQYAVASPCPDLKLIHYKNNKVVWNMIQHFQTTFSDLSISKQHTQQQDDFVLSLCKTINGFASRQCRLYYNRLQWLGIFRISDIQVVHFFLMRSKPCSDNLVDFFYALLFKAGKQLYSDALTGHIGLERFFDCA